MSDLTIHDIAIGYQGTTVLRNISIQVQCGEVLAVIGPNGVGKSSLLRALTGVAHTSNGKVTFQGRDLATMSAAERARTVAIVPQTPHLPPAFTVHDIVMMGRTPHLPWFGKEGARDENIVQLACEQTDVADFARRRVDELSGGQQQRVVIARALAQEPAVLCLDEATSHLDWKHQIATLRLIRQIAQSQSLAVIAAIHDLNLAGRFADRIAVLHRGSLHSIGRPQEILTPDLVAEVFQVEVTAQGDRDSQAIWLVPKQDHYKRFH